MGKRIQPATVSEADTDTSFGQRQAKQEGDSRLRRRLLAIEKLETNDKRQVLQLIDAFIERGQLKRKVASQTQA